MEKVIGIQKLKHLSIMGQGTDGRHDGTEGIG